MPLAFFVVRRIDAQHVARRPVHRRPGAQVGLAEGGVRVPEPVEQQLGVRPLVRVPDRAGRGRRADRHGGERPTGPGGAGHIQADAGRARSQGVQEQRGGHVPHNGQPVAAAAAARGTAVASSAAAAVGRGAVRRPETRREDQVPTVRHNVTATAVTIVYYRRYTVLRVAVRRFRASRAPRALERGAPAAAAVSIRINTTTAGRPEGNIRFFFFFYRSTRSGPIRLETTDYLYFRVVFEIIRTRR